MPLPISISKLSINTGLDLITNAVDLVINQNAVLYIVPVTAVYSVVSLNVINVAAIAPTGTIPPSSPKITLAITSNNIVTGIDAILSNVPIDPGSGNGKTFSQIKLAPGEQLVVLSDVTGLVLRLDGIEYEPTTNTNTILTNKVYSPPAGIGAAGLSNNVMYTVPVSVTGNVFTVLDIDIVNNNAPDLITPTNSDANVGVSVVPVGTTLDATRVIGFIEKNLVIPGHGSLNRTCIVMATGDQLVIDTNKENVSFRTTVLYK